MPTDDEDFALRRLVHRFHLIKALEAQFDEHHWDLAAEGSELAGDDAASMPYATSHLVGHSLAFGLDCIRSARMLFEDPEHTIRLPMTGHYPVLRAAMEASALAVWVLLPDDRQERVTRTLRARWEDIVQDRAAVLAMTETVAGASKAEQVHHQKARQRNAKYVSERKRNLWKVAERARVPKEEVERGLPGFGPITLEAGTIGGVSANHVHGMWRMLSGMSHPSASRSLALSDIDEVSESGGVIIAQMTASTNFSNTAIEAAFNMHLTALELTAQRGGRPDLVFRAPPELRFPPGYEHLAPKPHRG